MKRIYILLCGPLILPLFMGARCTPEQIQAAINYNSNKVAVAENTNDQNYSVWDRLAECESGGNWHINTGNGYTGGLQFANSTWRAYGGGEFTSHAYKADRETQIMIAKRVLDDVGWNAWPSCSRKLGLR